MSNKKVLALVGEDSPTEALASLRSLGFEVSILPRHAQLASPVASHADMLFFVLGGKVFCPREYIKGKKELSRVINLYGYKIVKCRTHLSEHYPDDIAFNFALVGNKIFGRTDKMAKRLSKHMQKSAYELIKVKQGYAKCSSVVLNDKALITADSGIEKAARANGFDVLKIENSQAAVKLDGYDYGFIGGACGVFGNTVYFTGSLDIHPNGTEIKDFCQQHGFNIISLSSNQLTDIGGIIFLPEVS